jgi:cation diffusion facilitator CzcD-associated flavoprotein CzcO
MMNESVDDARGLDWLERQVRRELEIFHDYYQPWVPPAADKDGKPVTDVLIVGGGLYGMGLAWGLIRSKITNIMVLDQAQEGLEGIWLTSARMKTLRTAKELTGLEFGIPSLSVHAYWEAKFGCAAWAELDRVPRLEWFRYLKWFRDVLDIPVRNNTEVVSIDGDGDLVRVTIRQGGKAETLFTRRLVLATGLLGSGGAHVPTAIVKNLPADRWAHSSDEIDFARLRGADVGVLGAGASPSTAPSLLSRIARQAPGCSAAVQKYPGSAPKEAWRTLALCGISPAFPTLTAGNS